MRHGIAGRIAFATGLALAAPGPIHAALPDWARPIADAAPPVPASLPSGGSRVLFSETRWTVHPDASVSIRRRFALQALTTRADEEVGIGTFAVWSTMKMKQSKAWHVPPDKAKGGRSWALSIDLALSDSFISDEKTRVLPVAGVKKGSIVFYEFEAIDRPYFLMVHHFFHEGAPADRVRFQLELPPGWKQRVHWLRHEGPAATQDGAVSTWELRDLPGPVDEEMAPDPVDDAPLLAVQVVPAGDVAGDTALFADWSDFARWYGRISAGRDDVTPPIAVAAERAVAAAGDGADLLARVESAGRQVRDRVRYVAVELGIGGYQPRPAAQTLENLYGDCKDKGTLLQAMLSSQSVPSYPVLVNLTRKETVVENDPIGLFNHYIVAVPVPPGVAPPERFLPALLDAGDLGRLLIVDTTDEMISIGSLSAGLSGKKALVITKEGGRVVTLPGDSASAHRIVRSLDIEATEGPGLRGRWESTYSGQFAADARAHYRMSHDDRRKEIERRLKGLWPDALMTDHAVDYETGSGAFVERVSFQRAAGWAKGAVAAFPGAPDEIARVSLGRRRSAVAYDHPGTIRYEVRYRGVPGDPPGGRELQGEGWSVSTEFERRETDITGVWELKLERPRFDPADFPELRKLWAAMTATTSAVIAQPPSDGAAGGF